MESSFQIGKLDPPISTMCTMLLESDQHPMPRDKNITIIVLRYRSHLSPEKSYRQFYQSILLLFGSIEKSIHPEFRSVDFICSTINIFNTNSSSKQSTRMLRESALPKHLRYRDLPGTRGSSKRLPWGRRASSWRSQYRPSFLCPFFVGHWHWWL